jgi:hypothetical protein
LFLCTTTKGVLQVWFLAAIMRDVAHCLPIW